MYDVQKSVSDATVYHFNVELDCKIDCECPMEKNEHYTGVRGREGVRIHADRSSDLWGNSVAS